ncbi:LysR family transcriptional regulator [Nitrospirillum iridis]|uniref:LysR family nod box-dependent transcriptional activator n=1 Tax=Nitrospirillum iridis TaxID=765888 RepID=A0A7X0B5K0_9PROT|nr:LysR family transcriptional regulator [Nitrospirillum iridis]MBB6255401.1 LysR family nod box-dependent transcriptional activator [Nitrospirillum iridis]
MRFDGLDLNLLVALEALIQERNVSAAARRLNLTQPAVTGALNRLRDYFQDDLLVLHGRRMLPTPKAESLAGPVRRALLQIRGEITRAGNFDPATAVRHFLIVASDYAYAIVLADLFAKVASEAPSVSFEVILPSSQAGERLDRAEVDLMFTVIPFANPQYPSMQLWTDEDVIISWSGAGYDNIEADTFFSAGHAVATFGPDRRPSVTDEHIAKLGFDRRVEILLPNFADLCPAIVGTKRLATMHRRYAEHFARFYPIKLHPTWVKFPQIVELALWHEVRDKDAGVRWLLDNIKELADSLPSQV